VAAKKGGVEMPNGIDGVIGDPEVQQLIVAARQTRDFLNQILSDQNILNDLDDQLRDDVNNAWGELRPSMGDEMIDKRFSVVNSYDLMAVGLTGAQLNAKLNALRSALENRNVRKALELAMMLWGSLAAILKLKEWAEGMKEILELIKALLPEERH
jgi:hypothetical protein